MTSRLLLTVPILRQMHEVEGWFLDEEADLLISATAEALSSLPTPHAIVEVGSYCGRSTVVLGAVVKSLGSDARVYAIDPHEGEVGAADVGLEHTGSTLERFEENIAKAGITEIVIPLRQRSYDTVWNQPISVLLLDGLHDYSSVATDFNHFEAWLLTGAIVAFHDYSTNFPGVVSFVDELTSKDQYERIHLASSLMVVRRLPSGSNYSGTARAIATTERVAGSRTSCPR